MIEGQFIVSFFRRACWLNVVLHLLTEALVVCCDSITNLIFFIFSFTEEIHSKSTEDGVILTTKLKLNLCEICAYQLTVSTSKY